ncbi:MAG: hypothetical protein KC766_11365 [Myxococcales bacterium]|nr:hypothetical protein [Myxococcales bacterium]
MQGLSAKRGLVRRLGALLMLFGAVGCVMYVAERNQRGLCEARVEALGERAPVWRNPSGAAMCSAESRTQALTLLGVLEQHPGLPRVSVRVEPSLIGSSAQVDLAAAVVLAPPEDVTLRDPGVWLHELAHLQSSGKRPQEPIARRVLRAVEEGAADYYAASLSGSTTLGVVEGRAQRDLSQSVEPRASEWAALAFGAADPHRFGWALAARLWRRFGADAQLASDLLQALARIEPRGRPGARVVRALVLALPPRSRPALERELMAWLPAELQPLARVEAPVNDLAPTRAPEE